MKAVLHGQLNGTAAVAVVGTWDPLMTIHEDLFRILSEYGRRISLSSVVIMLHPPPPSFIPESPAEWPVYDDPQTRISLIKDCGITATLLIDFEKKDLDAPPEDFFDLLRSQVKIDELWLGAHQTLGRGPDAANEALVKAARRRKIHLRRLPEINQRVADDARELLRHGYLAALIDFIGRPPVWARPGEGKLRLAWPPGFYRCVPFNGPTGRGRGSSFRVRLSRQKDSVCSFQWPHEEIRWLAFVAGPTDEKERSKKQMVKKPKKVTRKSGKARRS
jgi:hypothetical protein